MLYEASNQQCASQTLVKLGSLEVCASILLCELLVKKKKKKKKKKNLLPTFPCQSLAMLTSVKRTSGCVLFLVPALCAAAGFVKQKYACIPGFI